MKTCGILVPAIVIALLAGCSKPPDDSARAATSDALSTAPTPSTAPPPSAAAAPPRREYSAPAPERLGVLAPGTGIPVGQKVPDLSARNLDGNQVTLSSLYAKGPILLAFYRGGWCPYCNSEIHALTVAYPEYRKRGVMPVAVSVDKPEAEAKMSATYSIPFPVLSDNDATMIEGVSRCKERGRRRTHEDEGVRRRSGELLRRDAPQDRDPSALADRPDGRRALGSLRS